MSKKRYEWIFENGENEIIDNITGQYVTISSPELLNEKDQKIADLEAKLAESKKENTKLKEVVDCVDKLKQFNADMNDYALVNRDIADEIYCEHQDKISFAVDILEELADCSNYINSNLDSECGSYVSEKVIRDKIKCLKGNKDE